MFAGLVNVRDLSDLMSDELKKFLPCLLLISSIETEFMAKGLFILLHSGHNFMCTPMVPCIYFSPALTISLRKFRFPGFIRLLTICGVISC